MMNFGAMAGLGAPGGFAGFDGTDLVATPWPDSTMLLVYAKGGRLLGFIRKYNPKRGYTFPWTAFAPGGQRMLGSFYGRAGKAQARAAVEANAGRP